jgi:CRP-like cAMP-binding protein
MVQGETDTCYRMKADAFRQEMDRRGVFYELLTHYAQALVGFIMQSTACNAVHSVEQRLARWLLMARDRMGSDEFPLTQGERATVRRLTRRSAQPDDPLLVHSVNLLGAARPRYSSVRRRARRAN